MIWKNRYHIHRGREFVRIQCFTSCTYLFLVMMLQIRDLTVYIEAQKTLDNITDSDDIKGGTLLPVPAKESSPGNSRKKKGGRRRN